MTRSNSQEAIRALEASVLGAVLVRPETLTEFPRLETADFTHAGHRSVFTAMRNLEAAGRPIDVVTIQAECARAGANDVDFGLLGLLTLEVPTPSNAFEYVRQIREASLGRRVRHAMAEVIAQGEQLELNGGELLSMALESLSRIDADQPDSASLVAEVLRRRMKQLEQIAADRIAGLKTLTGFPTGIAKLDEKIGGWQPGIVTIVAARPGMGKSSLGLATADECSKAGFGVHLFSLEDTEEAYADRTLSRSSGVPAETLRNADLQRGEISDISRAMHGLKGRKWLVDGRSGISADEIVRSVRRHRRANGTCVVIVDYVQLVRRHPRMSGHEALTEIVTTLADAAKLDRLAYVVMSQLNRKIEERTDKRPQMQDLRESGSLEERSKCVVGLYRGSVYGKPIKGIDWHPDWKQHSFEPDEDEFASTAQVCVLKNNNGRTGNVWASWHGPTTRLS